MQTNDDPGRLLDALSAIGLHLSKDLDILEVLTAIVERTMELTGADFGAAATVGASGITRFVHRGLTDEEVAGLPHLPEGRGLLGAVLEGRAPIRLEVLSEDPRSVGFPSRHVAMDALLAVPIQHGDSLVGALYLTKRPGSAPFTDADQSAVEAMGALAAVGIQNARLFESESERAAQGALLRDIAWSVRHSLDIEEVLTTTVEQLGIGAGVDRCFIRSVESPGGDLLGPIEYEWAAEGVTRLAARVRVQYPVSSLAARTMRTQWSIEVSKDARMRDPELPGTVDDLLEAGTAAVLSTPLDWGGDLLGVVTFHSLRPRTWTESDIAFIEGAAREVSVAIHHARLYGEALNTAEKLRELNDLRSDFVSMVSHELRSPMTVVAGIAHLLLWRKERLPEADRDQLLDTLERESRRLTRMVSEFLDLEAIDRGRIQLQLELVNLVELAAEAMVDSGYSPRVDLITGLEEAKVSADRDRVKQVILNLISNAAKFSDETAPIILSVEPSGDEVKVSVKDRGPGIPAEQMDKLFERFSRLTTTVGRAPGSGIGLYVSRMIVEMHAGRIWAESPTGAGATFSFTLPR
ncbi:MAG: GAF domain-containing protein [Actinomycetota bacterium]